MKQLKRKVYAFEDKQIEDLLNYIKNINGKYNRGKFKDRNFLIIYLASTLGLRLNEVITINLKNIDFKKRLLLIPPEINKLREEQFIYLHNKALNLLIEYINKYKNKFKEGYIFYSPNKNSLYISKSTIQIALRNYLKDLKFEEIKFINKAGRKIRKLNFHSLRKYFCTKLLLDNKDKSLPEIAKVTRHKNLNTLYKYYLDLNEPKIQEEILNNTFK